MTESKPTNTNMEEATSSPAEGKKKIEKILISIKEYILITFGVALYVTAWKALLLPYTIVGGAATGISAIVYFIIPSIQSCSS